MEFLRESQIEVLRYRARSSLNQALDEINEMGERNSSRITEPGNVDFIGKAFNNVQFINQLLSIPVVREYLERCPDIKVKFSPFLRRVFDNFLIGKGLLETKMGRLFYAERGYPTFSPSQPVTRELLENLWDDNVDRTNVRDLVRLNPRKIVQRFLKSL